MKAKLSNEKRKRSLFILAFLLPGIALFLVIYAYPLVNIVVTSFSKWNFKNLARPEFLGFSNLFDNYKRLLTKDYYFKTALLNSLKWAGLAGIIQVPFAILVALVLSKKPKLWRFAQNAFIIPNIISSAAIGLIFLNMYDPARGLVTLLLQKFIPGFDTNLLANPKTAFWCITFSFVLFGGTIMLMILAQINAISSDIFEAAELDGATGIRLDWHITLPLIKPALGTALILACNYGLVIFNEVSFITKGGPDGATYSLSYYIFQTAMGSTKLNFALANTAGVLLFIVGLAMVAVINAIFNRKE